MDLSGSAYALILTFVMAMAAPQAHAAPLFVEACQTPQALLDRPATGLTHLSYPLVDRDGRKASQFLAGVLQIALQKLEKDLIFSQNLRACLTELKGRDECAPMEEFALHLLPQVVKDIRFQLLASQSPLDIKSSFGVGDTVPNSRMRDWGTAKVHPWEPATRSEYATVRQVLKEYRAETIAAYLKAWNRDRYTGRWGERRALSDSLLVTRLRHFEQYRALLAAAPFLQYFSSAETQLPEVLERFGEFEVNAKLEKTYLQGLVRDLESSDPQQISASVSAALQYNAYVEFALLEYPEYCGLMTSVIETHGNRSLAFGLGVGVPLLVASVFAPEIFAYPLGIIASGYFILESYNAYELARVRATSILFLEPGTETNKSLYDARKGFETEVLLFPTAFMGSRVFGTTLRTFASGRIVKNTRLNDSTYLPKRLLQIFATYGRKPLLTP